MSVAALVLEYAKSLPDGEMFATRDLLSLGRRGAIDTATYRLVREGILSREAWGVFRLAGTSAPEPGPEEVALVKARAFFKTIYKHGLDAARILKLEEPASTSTTFVTDGPTSSFKVRRTILVRFQKACPRKIQLKDTRLGLLVRALWHLGRDHKSLKPTVLNETNCADEFAKQVNVIAKIMPEWMFRLFRQERRPAMVS